MSSLRVQRILKANRIRRFTTDKVLSAYRPHRWPWLQVQPRQPVSMFCFCFLRSSCWMSRCVRSETASRIS